MHGSIASFGTYTVDEANQTFTVRYLGSTFPNRERTEETWPVVINGDELRMTHRSTSVGGPPSPHFNLGRVLLEQDKVEEAKRSFERALAYGLAFLPALQGLEYIKRRPLQGR